MNDYRGSAFEHIHKLLQPNETTIVLLVLDGLGGLPREPGGPTELEAAHTPNMDALAVEGITGLHVPVAAGIVPGSGPGHLGVFGYDPLSYGIGRGVLAAAGIDFDLQAGDVAARGNFCTVDDAGNVIDRRAGRIETRVNERLCGLLRRIHMDRVEVFVEPIKEHRLLLVLRGEGLSDAVADTDPQETGVPPRDPAALEPEAGRIAGHVRQFVEEARTILRKEFPANMVLLRGFASKPDWPPFTEVFGLRAAAAAGYPMYCGLARLLGMDILPHRETLEDRVELIGARFSDYDFFFLHMKETDSRGEDGDFEAKVRAIEKADEAVLSLKNIGPDVLIITGDHSTPATLRAHSWHPVPALLWSRHCRPDGVRQFGERACLAGGMGPRFPAVDLLPLALAHARRLKKYGA